MEDLQELQGTNTHSSAAYDAHDVEVLAAISHPDMISPAPAAAGQSQRPSQGDRECNRSWFEGFPDARVMLSNQVTCGDYIVQEGSFEGTNTGTFKTAGAEVPATGRSLKGRYAQVSRTSNGLIVSTRLYFDRVEP